MLSLRFILLLAALGMNPTLLTVALTEDRVFGGMLDKQTWVYIVATNEALLAVANLIISGALVYLYRRSPELTEWWGPAGTLSTVFALLFFAKAVARILTTVALFQDGLWNALAIVDTVIGFFAWVSAVCLLWIILHPTGARKLLRDRAQHGEPK